MKRLPVHDLEKQQGKGGKKRTIFVECKTCGRIMYRRKLYSCLYCFLFTSEIVASRTLKHMRNNLLEVQVSGAGLLVIEFS